MIPNPVRDLARLLVRHSTALVPGDKVLIEATSVSPVMVQALIQEANAAGAVPYVSLKENEILREIYGLGTAEAVRARIALMADIELHAMKQMNAYIGVRGNLNMSEFSRIPQDKMKLYQDLLLTPVHFQWRVPKTKWVILRGPTPSMAQEARMPTDAFEEFYFSVCLVDYEKMERAVAPLKALMERTERVRIVSPKTDLSFSITQIPVIPCCGKSNVPDGECFTAPVRDSVEGCVRFNTRTVYNGIQFSDIALEYERGRVVRATASDTAALTRILDSDEGARYLGEFSLAFNPYVTFPMCDILFDEKICGSLHMALGAAYEDADNGNRSSIHWDMVLLQDREHGGGEVWFDGALIRKDGQFVLPELAGLNPENLR
jgi:aminopeptidase